MSDLIDRQAFLKQERKFYCEDCDRRKGMKNGKLTFCYEIGEAPCRACWCDDVLTDLEDFPASPRWVRCEDDKPKERDYYFAFTEDAEAFVGEYIPSVDQWWNGDDLILTVTHWMPIEPPNEGERREG